MRRRENGAGTQPKFNAEKKRWEQWLSYRDSSETLKRKALYGKTQREITKKAREFKASLAAGMHVDANKITVEQWFTRWFTTYKQPAL